jgi:hypothetical protein
MAYAFLPMADSAGPRGRFRAVGVLSQLRRNWPPTDDEKSDLDIALEMEGREHDKQNAR